MAWRWRLGLVALVCACGTGTIPDSTVRDAADEGIDSGVVGVDVTIGTGQSDWEDLPRAGGNVELIYGAQGGYHIWGRVRFRGFNPDVRISFRVTRLDDGRVTHMPVAARRWIADGVRRGLVDLGGGEFSTDAELVIEDIRCSDELVGRTIRFQVFVEEMGTGRIATDERTATVIDLVNPVRCAMPTG